MFTKSQFVFGEAQQKLNELKGRFSCPVGSKIDEVNNTLEEVLYALQVYPEAPKYVLTRALYDNKDQVFSRARFVVRPRAKEVLKVSELKRVFELSASEDFFDRFIDEMAQWFDEYNHYARLEENLDELNADVASVVEENQIPFSVQFSLGEGIIDVSDDSVIVGLSEETVMGLSSLPLFDTNIDVRRESYKEAIAETLKECVRPYDIVKVKSIVTRDLGIYSRRAVSKLIRKIVNRKAEFVRNGVGYIETDSVLALVEKKTVTDEVAKEIEVGKGVVVTDNKDMTLADKREGLTKIVVQFKLSPLDKETGAPVDISLEELLK